MPRTKVVQVYNLDRKEDPSGVLLGVTILRGGTSREYFGRPWQARRIIDVIQHQVIVSTALGRIYLTAVVRTSVEA